MENKVEVRAEDVINNLLNKIAADSYRIATLEETNKKLEAQLNKSKEVVSE